MKISNNQSKSRFENSKNEQHLLMLFIAGSTFKSEQAIINIKKICEEYLKGQYDLEVIDIYQNSKLAKKEGIIVAPTLIKKQPLPIIRIIGDMSNIKHLLAELNI